MSIPKNKSTLRTIEYVNHNPINTYAIHGFSKKGRAFFWIKYFIIIPSYRIKISAPIGTTGLYIKEDIISKCMRAKKARVPPHPGQ